MGRKKHKWTWKGEEMEVRKLAVILGFQTPTTLYEVAKKIKSAKGEKIQKYLQKKKEERDISRITFDGKKRTHTEIASMSGLQTPTFTARVNRYGIDCCLTYFPGRIPTNLQKRQAVISKKHGEAITRGHTEANWEGLSGDKRTANLAKIKQPGTWERTHILDQPQSGNQ